MQEIERSAASVEEAIESALADLGLSEQEATIRIIQEPKSGFLGLNPSPAIVRVRPARPDRVPDQGEERADGEEVDEELEEQAELAADFVEGLLDVMRLDADVEINSSAGITYVEIWGPEDAEEGMGILIGRHGRTLDAIQDVVRATVQHRTASRCLVIVDVEDYRKRRRSQVARRAGELARRVSKTGRAEAMEPMSAFERKIVHDVVAEIGGLETASEGDEPNRHVVVKPISGRS
jgi:spoIIIJ-associated protein